MPRRRDSSRRNVPLRHQVAAALASQPLAMRSLHRELRRPQGSLRTVVLRMVEEGLVERAGDEFRLAGRRPPRRGLP